MTYADILAVYDGSNDSAAWALADVWLTEISDSLYSVSVDPVRLPYAVSK
jgi:hypothetical protein